MGFNSSEYAWVNLQMVINNKLVTGFRGLKYKTTQEKEFLHGAGADPRAIQRGKKTYSGEVVLLQSEYNALQTAAKSAGLDGITDLTVDISLAYVPSKGQVGPITRKTLLSVEFTEAEEGFKEGDKFMEITLPFLALGIK